MEDVSLKARLRLNSIQSPLSNAEEKWRERTWCVWEREEEAEAEQTYTYEADDVGV